MKEKMSRPRLSPNEEEQLLREELDRRRKLRLQQVREQERFIARQVRRQVQERRQQQMQILAESLQHEWRQQHTNTLQSLHTHYQQSLRAVGQAQRSAQENEPDVEALSQKRVERQERAKERHREALRELSTRRHEEQEQQRRQMEARRRALLEEKRRSERVCSLPPPPPDPVESVVLKTPRPLRPAAEHFSITHCHMTQPTVDREADPEQQRSAQQAAVLEVKRLEELQRDEDRDREERLERARVRGEHALRREQHTQDRARLLCELERLQQADLLRRRQALTSVPAQIFQPLYRQQELRNEQQRDLEIAFQDVYTQERKVKGDLVLQLVPEPLPPPSAGGHDEELDVTLDPEGEQSETSLTESPASSVPPADPGRRALTRMLERIRSQRDPRSHDAEEQIESVDTGSLSSGVEDQAPDVSDEAVVAGNLLPASTESESRAHTPTQDAMLQQLTLLEELEQKRCELQQRLRETQQANHMLQDTPPEPTAEVDSDDTRRLHQYQQRLLQQNRLHRRYVEEARRRLQEYQCTLKLGSAMSSSAAVRVTPQQTVSPDPPLTDSGETPDSQCPSEPPVSPPGGSGASLQDEQEDTVPEQDTVPLPTPAVVLELLLGRQHHTQVALQSEMESDRQHMRRQRDILQALLTADTQADQLSLITETETDTHAPETDAHTHPGLDGVCDPAHGNRGKVKPPVSRPPARLAFLHQMEQHELSAIQEVDSPVNMSLDTELQCEVDESESCSVSLRTFEDGRSLSEGSRLTGRISRMSWREALMQDSSSSSRSGVRQQPLQKQCLSDAAPPPSVDPDYLSSTTISTGSFSTSAAELSASSSVCQTSSEMKDPVQHIIEKYSQELSTSLRRAAVNSSWSSVLEEKPLRDGDVAVSSAEISGVFQPLQPHPDIDSSSSSSSSGHAVRAQGWSQTVNRILERLSDQLSLRHTPLLTAQDHPSSADGSADMDSSRLQEEAEHTGVFLPLPSDITLNESADRSAAPCVPLEAELCSTESADQSHHHLQLLRSDTHTESHNELQISADQLSIEADTVMEVTLTTHSRLQEEDLKPQVPSQDTEAPVVQEITLKELLERAQVAGDVKGILEESVISFISLPESESSEISEGQEPSCKIQDSSQAEVAFPQAVMLLEDQRSPAQRQRRDRLAQRSAHRAAQIKHTAGKVCPTHAHTADGLKSVCEVRICTDEHRRLQERTHRLYSQLEEVKQRKQMQIRQESNTKNRERARDFQRKTLERLRAKAKH